MTVKTSEGSTVPEDYNELEKQYGKLIRSLLIKHNKIERNAEDLYSYIWVRLIEADLLERFKDHAQKQCPKTLTAVEACDLLGVTWGQWITAMWAYHRGDPNKYDRQGNIVGRRRGRWMPTPINIDAFQARGLVGYSSKAALFDYESIFQLSCDERRFKNGNTRKTFIRMGRQVLDGVVVSEDRPEGCAKLPVIAPTKAQFRNYLVMAVLNHFANFCRTQDRRHKERPYTPPSYMDEDAPSWEATFPDKRAVEPDVIVALAEAKAMLTNTLYECLEGVSSCKPFEEHRIEMFGHLEKGASLMQALDSMSIPPRVRNAILDTVRPLAPDYAG